MISLAMFLFLGLTLYCGAMVMQEETTKAWEYYCDNVTLGINWTDSESDELEWSRIMEHCQ